MSRLNGKQGLLAVALCAAGLLASGCSVTQQLSKDCGGTLEQGCKILFGSNEAEENRLNAEVQRNNQQDAQIAQLRQNINLNISSINQLSAQNSDQSAAIVALQAQVQAQQTQLTALSLQDSVVDYLDCDGNGPGFDEVVLRTKSGKLVAYFEQSGNRFLTLLTPGSYRTTDAQGCNFTVNSSMRFCDSTGCR